MTNSTKLKLLCSCILAATLVGCGDDNDTVIVQPNNPTLPDNSEQATLSAANIAVYGDVDKTKFSETILSDSTEVLLLDDATMNASYSAMGAKLPQPVTLMAVSLAVPETEFTVSPELRLQADKYTNYIQQVLKDYDSAEINVLTNQVGSNPQSSTIRVELSVDFGSRVKSANYVRNAVLKAINEGNLPANVSQIDGEMGNKVNLQLTFWQDGNDILLWTGANLPEQTQLVDIKYGDLKTAAALTSSTVTQTILGQGNFEQKDGNTGGVDILWSIDGSGSMEDEQQNLANGAEQFFDDLNKAGVDYRLAVNTQGRDNYRYSCSTLRQTSIGTNFIDSKTVNALDEWRYLAKPGTSDSGTETGFYCVREVDLTGFDRPDAKNLVVFVSDEPENETFLRERPETSGYNYVLRDFNDYKQYFKDSGTTYFSIAGNSTLIRPTFNTIINEKDDKNFKCNGEGGWNDGASGGAHFAEIAKLTGGSSASICADSADWSTMFNRIIETATGLASKFNLDNTPIASSVKVTINGTPIPRDIKHENGFDIIYGQRNTAITFYGNSLPNKDDKIAVNYSYVESSIK